MNRESNAEIFNKAVNKVPPAQISYRIEWLEARKLKAENLTPYPVTGNGMMPMLNDGDYVMLDSSRTTVEDHKIYGLMVRGEFKIRHLVAMGNGDLITYCSYVHATKNNEVIKKLKIKKDVLILGLVVHRQGSV